MPFLPHFTFDFSCLISSWQNCHGPKQYNFVVSQFWRAEVWHQPRYGEILLLPLKCNVFYSSGSFQLSWALCFCVNFKIFFSISVNNCIEIYFNGECSARWHSHVKFSGTTHFFGFCKCSFLSSIFMSAPKVCPTYILPVDSVFIVWSSLCPPCSQGRVIALGSPEYA